MIVYVYVCTVVIMCLILMEIMFIHVRGDKCALINRMSNVKQNQTITHF